MAARVVEIAFLGSTAQLEASLERAGLVAKGSGDAIGNAFTSGTSKAGGAITKLSQQAAALGVPFAGSLGTIGKHLDDATSKTNRLHTAMSEAGKVTLLAGGAGLAAVGVEAVKLGVAFETAGAKIQGSTGQSAASIKKLTDAFAGTAGKFEVSGQEMESAYAGVAGQLKLTEGHALGAGEALKFESSAAELSTAAHENLATTTGALASVMQTFHLSVNQASGASDELFNISRGLGVPVAGVATAIDKLHGRLGALAPSLKDTGALMLDVGEHGIQGTRGVMVVNTAMQTLVGGSKNTTGALQALGVNIFNQQGHFIGLQGVIAQLQPKLAGLSQQEEFFALKSLFGASAAQVMGQVIAQGVPGFQKATDAATKLGTAHAAAKAQGETLTGEMHTLEASVNTLGGKFGLILVPEVKLAGQALSDGIGWLGRHKVACEALAEVITTVLGAAVAVFAYDKAVAFIGGLQRMTTGLLKLGPTAATAATEMGAAEGTMVTDAEGTAAGVDAAIGSTGIGLALLALGFAATDLATHWKTAMTALEEDAQTAANAVIKALNTLIEAYDSTIGKLTGDIGKIHELTGAGAENTGPVNAQGQNIAQGHPVYGQGQAGVLEKMGLGANAAEGVVAAYKAEGGTPTAEDKREGAFGLGQWVGPRKAALAKFAASKHEPISSEKAQLEFTAKELKERGELGTLNKAKSPHEAADLFIKGFEKPESPSTVEARVQASHSNAALHKLMQETGSGSSASSKAKKTVAALGIPTGVATMLATAQALLGAPYKSGGGHGSSAQDPIEMLKKIGVDCSGFVSKVLSSGGLPTTGLTTQGLAKSPALSKGAGRYVTVYDRANAAGNSHVIADILGHYFESGGNPKYNPKGGVSMLTSAQAAGELSSGGFQAYHPTDLNAPVRGGVSQAAATAGVSTAQAIASAIAAQIQKLSSSGTGLFKKYETDLQSGTVNQLKKLIGSTTANRSGSKSVQHSELDTLVSGLRAVHEKAMTDLASKLVTVHHEAQVELTQELRAVALEAAAQGVQNEATEQKDRTQAIANAAAAQLQVVKDEAARQTDQFSAAAKEIDDATALIKDSWTTIAQSISDATQTMSDTGSGEVQAMQDKTATAVANSASAASTASNSSPRRRKSSSTR